MGSPVPPEAAASLDPKPQDVSVAAVEANGHSPSAELKKEAVTAPEDTKVAESEAANPVIPGKPLVNGSGDSDSHEKPKGEVSDDIEMQTDETAVAPKPDAPLKSTERPEETSAAKQEGETKLEEPENKPEAKTQPSTEPQVAASLSGEISEDVEMTESAAVEEQPQPAQEPKDTEALPDAPAAGLSPPAASQDAPKINAPESESSSKPALPEASSIGDTTQDSASAVVNTNPPTEEPVSAADDIQPASLSQLAIEAKDEDKSPVQESVEVSMTDASTVKVAREREDDVEDEPAPKRARTEPKEDETLGDSQAEVPEESAAPATPPSFAEFPRWNDEEDNARPITPYQRRRIRAVIARVKKTKHGSHFRDSVPKLWPALGDKYLARIEKSMDLSEIERNLRDPVNTYNTFGEFKKDLGLILENTHTFNGADHYITQAAHGATKAVWVDVYQIPEEEPAPAKPPPKTSRIRESRSANPKPETAAPTEGNQKPSAPQNASTGESTAAAMVQKTGQAAEGRRASTATEGDRPKRTVRAPKPKDIDYTTKPSRKKLKPELQFCEEVLGELMAPKHYRLNQWFLYPVDAVALGIPDYYSIIKHPMDLTKVSSMLAEGEISTLKDFDKNVKLIFANCYQFNGEPNPDSVSYFAKQLEDMYISLMRGKDSWLAKHSKANPPPPSNDTDDEEDEEDEEEGEEGSGGVDLAQEVKDLEARLREEMGKQTNLFAAEQPNESMIQIQQGIVNMVQEALLKAKTKLNELRQKNGGATKPAKKSSKTSKTKGSGGGGGRKSGGAAAQPKKVSGGAKKGKKNLTAADKDAIANAINDLEGPHLDRAIDIIKRDTGSKESEDGELELDIDQLSNDALLKLWELCKKVLPGFGKDSSSAANASPEQTKGSSSKSAGKTAAKPKKNKPMSAQEQEARIAQLREMRNLYKSGQEPGDLALSPQAGSGGADDSSEDSSEEE